MYLRLNRDQIRFRLTQEEIKLLQRQGQIEEAMPTAWLQLQRFIAKIDDVATMLTVSGDAENLILHLPSALVETLAATKPSKEGITATQTDDAGKSFELILEIDVRKER